MIVFTSLTGPGAEPVSLVEDVPILIMFHLKMKIQFQFMQSIIVTCVPMLMSIVLLPFLLVVTLCSNGQMPSLRVYL